MRWTTEPEINLLKRYASNCRLGIVEIGTMDGDTAAEMSQVTKLPIYIIDPIIPDSMPPFIVGDEDKIRMHVHMHPNMKFWKDYSYNVVTHFPFKFDFIFFDGSHLYENIVRDYMDWVPLLEKGGYFAFHDCMPTEDGRFGGHPGPTEWVKQLERTGNYSLVDRVDTIKVFRK